MKIAMQYLKRKCSPHGMKLLSYTISLRANLKPAFENIDGCTYKYLCR